MFKDFTNSVSASKCLQSYFTLYSYLLRIKYFYQHKMDRDQSLGVMYLFDYMQSHTYTICIISPSQNQPQMHFLSPILPIPEHALNKKTKCIPSCVIWGDSVIISGSSFPDLENRNKLQLLQLVEIKWDSISSRFSEPC